MKNVGVLVFAFLAFTPCMAQAAGAAASLFGVKGVVVQSVVFSNKKIADACNLNSDSLMQVVKKSLQTNGVPAVTAAEVNLDTITPAHIDLLPEVTSMDNQGFDCTSWISLSAQTNSNVIVPPIDTLRNVVVLYWHDGSLVETSQVLHERTLEDSLQKMTMRLADKFKADQPPTRQEQ